MSEVRVNNIVDYGGKGAPTFDNGAVISGISSLGDQAKIGSNVTITSGGINVSGVTTAATLSGNLTGDVNTGFVTATSAVIGSGVTINAGGLNITGVVTATTFEGDASSMTGLGMTITPLSYNPDVNDSTVPKATGIGITFDHRILAGSGNITLSIATNAGAAGTTVENFGVGSSVTIAGRNVSIDPTSDLNNGETYHISYPSGAFTNTSGDVSYVGTAYTFGVKPQVTKLWAWGYNQYGQLGLNNTANYSSPVQIPGTTWDVDVSDLGSLQFHHTMLIKSDGTLWAWGLNYYGDLGQNSRTYYSSPVQIPGTTWSKSTTGYFNSFGIKTDGTLWVWGSNEEGALGLNQAHDVGHRSSPTQVPGTTWSSIATGNSFTMAMKTDGTLWAWGYNESGALGQNQAPAQLPRCSSPTQIPGTTWKQITSGMRSGMATKTDGTLWAWGWNQYGKLGQNQALPGLHGTSSPVQIPGTTWNTSRANGHYPRAVKTDGTLWAWGTNQQGMLGIPSLAESASLSSPTQVGSDTTWGSAPHIGYDGSAHAVKTDGTLWSWGYNEHGQIDHNDRTNRSSPTQIGSDTNWVQTLTTNHSSFGIESV
jgi:alpha-tubulin suppressor-like RCC1 family protein